MQSVHEAIDQILNHGKANADDSLKVVANVKPWQHSSQGDVDFVKLPHIPPTAIECDSVIQLAPGTSKGSRHCIRLIDIPNIRFWKLRNPNQLQGHILECLKPIVVEHPEHGNQELEAGIWFVKFQRQHAIELKRIQD